VCVCVCMCVCIQSTQLVAAKVSRIKYSQLCAAVGARIALCIHTCRIHVLLALQQMVSATVARTKWLR